MNTKKILMYNGGSKSYYSCDNPVVLTKGKLYEIVAEKDVRGFQTNYTLKGIEGEFNSVWFDEPKSYFAHVSKVPVIGESMQNITRFERSAVRYVEHTSVIRHIEPITSDIYKVYIENTLYIVKVLSES